MSTVDTRTHAHQLIDRMASPQLSVVVNLLEDLLDPLTLKLANAPVDDEPITDDDRTDGSRSSEAELISTEDLLSGFGLSLEDFHRMAAQPPGPSI